MARKGRRRKAAGGPEKRDSHHGRGVSRIRVADLRYVPGHPYLGGLGEGIKARGGGEGGVGGVHVSFGSIRVFGMDVLNSIYPTYILVESAWLATDVVL